MVELGLGSLEATLHDGGGLVICFGEARPIGHVDACAKGLRRRSE